MWASMIETVAVRLPNKSSWQLQIQATISRSSLWLLEAVVVQKNTVCNPPTPKGHFANLCVIGH